MGDGRACDAAAELFEFVTLIHSAAHLSVETEPLFVGTALLGRLRLERYPRSETAGVVGSPAGGGRLVSNAILVSATPLRQY
jgi:hypothetical protein